MDFRSNEADRIAPKFPIRRCQINRTSERSHALSLVVATPARGGWSFDMDYAKPTDVVASMIDAAVVNMFVISTGMLLGAKVSIYDWWVWNQIPVTLGNLVGGFVFTGLALYATFKPATQLTPAPVAAHVPAE
jgi:hypothetical protein